MRLFRTLSQCTGTLLIAALTLPVHAETVDCTPVTSLPATIDTQGIYCLTGNLATAQTSGNAITITANNVTLDLNGWKVGGQAAGTATAANGIYSTANNVTIKNGIVRGFHYGIYLGGRGSVVQDMLVDNNTEDGIYVTGSGAVIEHNQVIDTGGSTLSSNMYARGILANGNGSRVSDNTVSGVTSSGTASALGIVLGSSDGTIRDNVVSNAAKPTGGGGSYGIYQYQNIVVNNTVSNFNYCIYSSSAGIYAHNTVYNCTTNYVGGTAGAGNSP